MEKRKLGQTTEKLSVIGFGGIVVMNETKKDAAKYVSNAIDRGINYFDVAPEYGNAQEMLGPALNPYRKDVFLACKTLERTKIGAKKEFHDSLKKLKTDYFDLYQLHSVMTMDEVNQIMGPNGALEHFTEVRDKGYVKYIGFTAHTEEAAIALMDAYDFTSILFPFNWALWFRDNFGPAVFKKAKDKGIGILALKALAKGAWGKDEQKDWEKCWYSPLDDFAQASMALRFTLSLPVTSAVSPSHAELLWLACDIADDLRPLSSEELAILRSKATATDTILEGLSIY